MRLWDRLVDAKRRLKPVQSKYRVIYENPYLPDEPAQVLVPDPNWLACAIQGGILPPVDAYISDYSVSDDEPKSHPYVKPIGPMTEEEAIEYLVMKDIDPAVWRDYQGNRSIIKIVPVEMVPSDRTYRNAWRIRQ